MNSEIVAIIPARGGSRGIPRKNIRELAGKPLIAYTIETALGSRMLDRVIVSTDDEKIAEVTKECNAEVILRPMELAQDTTPTEPVLQHTIRYLEEKENYSPDLIVLLQPTSPIRNKDDIDNAIKKLIDTDADSLLSVCESHSFLWKLKGGVPTPINYDYKNRKRRQEIDKEYKENGSIYITKRAILMEGNNRLGGKIQIYVMNETSSIEVDTLFDFRIAECIMRYKNKYMEGGNR